MNLDRINEKVGALGALMIKRRFIALGFVLALCVFGVTGIPRVKAGSSNDDWFDKDDPMSVSTDEFEDLFGNSQSVTVLFQAADVFAPEVLEAVRELGREFLEKVPYAESVTSLADLEISVGNDGGIEVVNPFGDGVPADPVELARLRALVLSRPSLVNKLVSDDAKETWLVLNLREYPEEEEWKRTDVVDPMYRTGEAVLEILDSPRWKSSSFTLKAAGMPVSETEERAFFGKETMTRVLLGFVAMLALLALLVRSLRGTLVPAFTTVMAIVVVFGAMGWFGIMIDTSLMTIPVLLGMALSVGYSIHIVNSFKTAYRDCGDRRIAAVRAVEHTGWPILFTVITTVASLLSFLAVRVSAIRWLGFASSAVVVTVFVFVVVLVPVTLSFGRDGPDAGRSSAARSTARFRALGSWVLARRRACSVAFCALAAAGFVGLTKVDVDMDMFKFMGLRIPYVQRLHDIVHSRLGSFYSFDVMIDLGEADGAKVAETLRSWDALLEKVGALPLVKKEAGAAKVYSVLDIVKDMHRTLNGDDPAFYSVPQTSEMVSQLLFLYEMSGGSRSGEWVDSDYRYLRARAELVGFEAREIERERLAILESARNLFPGARISIIGSAMQFARINLLLVSGQIASIAVSLIVIAVLLMLAFMSVRIGLIGLIPNVVPVLATGGIMGFSGFQLDMMTMTIMPMLLGIAVDDTIHFITQMRLEFDRTGDYRKAVLNSFEVVGESIFMTTILLIVAFGVYVTSPVNTMRHIGLLASAGLSGALLADYVMTPILIYSLKPFGRERSAEASGVVLGDAV